MFKESEDLEELIGDTEEGNEARLVSENSTALDVEVLKAGHHGSRTSST